MLSFLKRKPEPPMPVEATPVFAGCDQQASQQALSAPQAHDDAKRNRQQNIKVSDDCAAAFAAIAKAQRLSRAELFEDLVAERLELLERRGEKIEV